MKAFIYFNLHKKLWSIKALEGPRKGLVIGHAEAVALVDVKPQVSEAGRQRVITERRKNVHAGLVGEVISVSDDYQGHEFLKVSGGYDAAGTSAITYNPYKYPHFVLRDDIDEAVDACEYALLLGDRTVYGWGISSHSLIASTQLDLFVA